MESYFIILVALCFAFAVWSEWRSGRRVDAAMKLLASRSYVEFAKGEDILAKKSKAEEKKVPGDGYTQVFE